MNAMQLLPKGHQVRVGNRRGVVTAAKWVLAHNGGDIPLHTIKFTERMKRGFGNAFKWEPLPNPQSRTVNYSFIEIL